MRLQEAAKRSISKLSTILKRDFFFEFSIDDSKLNTITNLRELNVSGNSISDLSPEQFRGLADLNTLDLSSNKLNEDLGPASFSTLPSSITYLDISSENY